MDGGTRSSVIYTGTGERNYKRSDTKWADSIPCPSNSETRSFVKKRLSGLKVKDGKTRL